MVRKIIPAGQREGDVTFKLGEATKYSQPLKKSSGGSKRTSTKRASAAPSKAPMAPSRKSTAPSVSSPSDMSTPTIRDNTPSIATTSKTFTGDTPKVASSPKSPSSVRRVFNAPKAPSVVKKAPEREKNFFGSEALSGPRIYGDRNSSSPPAKRNAQKVRGETIPGRTSLSGTRTGIISQELKNATDEKGRVSRGERLRRRRGY